MYYVLSRTYVGPNSQENTRMEAVWITTTAPTNNGRGEIQTEGWLGTNNDWAYYAHGEFENLKDAEKVAQEVIDNSEFPEAYTEVGDLYYATDDEDAVMAWDLAAINLTSIADWDDIQFRSEILARIKSGDVTVNEARKAARGTFCPALMAALRELESVLKDAEGWDGESYTVFTTDADDYIREIIDIYLDDWIAEGLFLPDNVFQNPGGDIWAQWPNGDAYFLDAVEGTWSQYRGSLPKSAEPVDGKFKGFLHMDLLEELVEER